MVGRPPKYEWNDKRDICHKLYVEQQLSTTDIVKWFANHFDIPESELPGPNQFATHFRAWGFPPRVRKKPTGETEAAILARVRELFNQNVRGIDIYQTLKDEGYDLGKQQLARLRKRHGMFMRAERSYKVSESTKRKRAGGTVNEEGVEEDEHHEDATPEEEATQEPSAPAPLDPEEQARREQRLRELELQSDRLLQSRKRRRRIRGYGHLPADTPGMQPRYNSETSLDECKAFLHLTNDTYLQIRGEFEAICREMGIIKMTLCAEGQWQASKDRLVRENMHLSSMLHPLQPDLDLRLNALNCICQDVTKRMRGAGKRMSIADASNLLHLDPIESKELRRSLYEILEADHFTTVLACGKEHVNELRDRWIAKSPLLSQVASAADPEQLRAIEALGRDVRKRFCDDLTKKNPERRYYQQHKHYGPGPGPAQGAVLANSRNAAANNAVTADTTNASPAATAPAPPPRPPQRQPSEPDTHPPPPHQPDWEARLRAAFPNSSIANLTPAVDYNLDPLLLPIHGPPWPPNAAEVSPPTPPPAVTTPAISIPAYFRLAPDSRLPPGHPRMWLGKLTARTMEALTLAATTKAPAETRAGAGKVKVGKVFGIVKNADGGEDAWLVERDDELEVYLAEAGEKAVFSVVFE